MKEIFTIERGFTFRTSSDNRYFDIDNKVFMGFWEDLWEPARNDYIKYELDLLATIKNKYSNLNSNLCIFPLPFNYTSGDRYCKWMNEFTYNYRFKEIYDKCFGILTLEEIRNMSDKERADLFSITENYKYYDVLGDLNESITKGSIKFYLETNEPNIFIETSCTNLKKSIIEMRREDYDKKFKVIISLKDDKIEIINNHSPKVKKDVRDYCDEITRIWQ